MKKNYENGIEKLEDINDINELYKVDRNLYYRVLRRAKLKGKSINEYLEEQGFTYTISKKRSVSISDDEIIRKLERKYLDRKVIKLYTDKNLYSLVLSRAEKSNQTIVEWLVERDFEYIKSKKGNRLSDSEIKVILLKMYPNRKVVKLSTENMPLYQMIKRRSHDIKEYFKGLGFEH